MVRHVHDGRDYWTLPGGGIEVDETPEEAAQREVFEETGVVVSTRRHLFTASSRSGRNSTYCFLMTEPENLEVRLGVDPEEEHLVVSERMLQEVGWHPITTVRDDYMVSKVMKALKEGL